MDGEAVIVLSVDAFAEQKIEFVFFSENPSAPAMDVIHIHHNIQIYQAVFHIVFLHIKNAAPAKVDNILKGVFHGFSVIHGEIVVTIGVNHHARQIYQLSDEMVNRKVRLKAPHEDRKVLFDPEISDQRRHSHQSLQKHVAHGRRGKKNISPCRTDRRRDNEIEDALHDAENVLVPESLCVQADIGEKREQRTEKGAEDHKGQNMTGIAEALRRIIIGYLSLPSFVSLQLNIPYRRACVYKKKRNRCSSVWNPQPSRL